MKERFDKNNPDIIYDLYITDSDNIGIISTKPLSRIELIEHIEDTIICYHEDCIFFEHDENLYLYLDLSNLNHLYIGYEEAAQSLPTHCRTPLTHLLSDTESNWNGDAYPDIKKIRWFVMNHIPRKLMKK